MVDKHNIINNELFCILGCRGIDVQDCQAILGTIVKISSVIISTCSVLVFGTLDIA